MTQLRHLYRGSASAGDLTSTFTRNSATVDENTVARAANARRAAKQIASGGYADWTDTGVTPLAGGRKTLLATGWDSDGETPVAVIRRANNETVAVYRGYTPTLQQSISFNANPEHLSGLGALSDENWEPRCGIFFYGLLILGCQIRNDADELVSIGFVWSDDYGATINRVPVSTTDGGGFVVPYVTGTDVPSSAQLLREWAISHHPTTQGSKVGVLIGMCDYVAKADLPGGGMAIGMRATRADDTTSTWSVEPVRKMAEEWDTAETTMHWHCATFVPGRDAFHVHIGDNPDNNRILSVPVDIANYDTATLGTPVDIHGGRDVADTERQDSPQSLMLQPLPQLGQYYGPGDVVEELHLKFVTAEDGSISISTAFDSQDRGSTAARWEALAAYAMPGSGYTCGGPTGTNHTKQGTLISRDGGNWVEINQPREGKGVVAPYGTKLMWIDSSTTAGASADPSHDPNIYLADWPTIQPFSPAALAPGGDNIADALAQAAAPDSGITVDFITYDGSQFLDSGGTALDPQPAAPPFTSDALMLHVTSSSPSGNDCGDYYLDAASGEFDDSADWAANLFLYNRNSEHGVQLRWQMGNSLGSAPNIIQEITPADVWIQRPYFNDADGGGATGRGQLGVLCPRTGTTDALDFIVAIAGVVQDSNACCYPQALDANGPDELETLTGFTLGADWTVAVTLQMSDLMVKNNSATHYLFTLYEDANNYVEVRFVPSADDAGDILAEFVSGGSTTDTLTVAVDLQRQSVAQIVISDDGSAQRLTARNGSLAPLTDTGAEAANGIAATSLRWRAADDTVTNINPINVEVDDAAAWDLATAQAWMNAAFSVPSGGDSGSIHLPALSLSL